MEARPVYLLMSKKDNPLSVYAVVSQISFVIIAPLLLFLVGGNFAVKQFGWGDGVMVLFVILGLLFMIGGAVSYFMRLIKLYGKEDKKAQRSFRTDSSETDYYDEYRKR